MISLLNSSDDFLRLQGIRHFIEKTGIPIDYYKGETTSFCIQCGNDQRGEFSICIKDSNVRNRRFGIINAFDTQVPVFQIPENTGKGDSTIGFYENEGESFPCITRFHNRIVFGFDIFHEIGLILSGNLEKIREDLDEFEKSRISQIPLLDIYENFIFKAILEGCNALGLPLVRKAYWPEGKRFAICLTHDVDELKKTYQWITRPLRYARKGDIQGIKNQISTLLQKTMGKEPYWTFEEILRINKKHCITSTFFFLKESARIKPHCPDTWHHAARCRELDNPEAITLIQRLSEEGNEIGLHGSYYSFNDPNLLSLEKEELEKISGEKIIGIRQHHLNLDIPNTWRYQEEAGLLYDTSLGFKDQPGFRFGTCFPFHPVAGATQLEILEIPLTIMDITLYDRPDRWMECNKIIDIIENRQGLLTLLWHPPVFNTLEYPGYTEIYERIISLCQKKGAWITGAGEIVLWWKARELSRLNYTVEKGSLKIVSECSDPRQEIEIYLPDEAKIELLSSNTKLINEDDTLIRTRSSESSRIEIVMRVE